ncbi:hypothetical protein LINGRAHAP2_LOCUS20981 [Linum grandiflorum]
MTNHDQPASSQNRRSGVECSRVNCLALRAIMEDGSPRRIQGSWAQTKDKVLLVVVRCQRLRAYVTSSQQITSMQWFRYP